MEHCIGASGEGGSPSGPVQLKSTVSTKTVLAHVNAPEGTRFGLNWKLFYRHYKYEQLYFLLSLSSMVTKR